MIVLDLSILNQKGTPMFNSDTFANRPNFGIVGRIFISTDTKEFFRDTGTSWELIGGPGSGTITGSGTVGTLPIWTTSSALGNSSLIEAATLISTTKDIQADAYYLTGAAAANGALYFISNRVTLANYNVGGIVHIEVNGGTTSTIFGTDLSLTNNGYISAVPTLTAANNASSVAIVGVNTLSYAAAFSSNNIGAVYGGIAVYNLQTFAGSATFANANVASGGASINSIDFSSGGSTITMTQSSGIRVMSGQQNLFQYQGTNSGTITHAAISQNTGFYRPTAATGILTITNAYSHLINALDDYGAGFTFTNRWGIYQAGGSDVNYFAASVLIGSNVNSGFKFQVNGTSQFNNTLQIIGNAVKLNFLNVGFESWNIGTVSSSTQFVIGCSTTPNVLTFTNAGDANFNNNVQLTGNGIKLNFLNSGFEFWNIGSVLSTTQFRIGCTTTPNILNFANNGSATFISSVTAAGIIISGANSLQLTGGTGNNWQLYKDSSNGLQFYLSGGGPAMYITSTQNLLVNTITDTGNKLYLNGSLRIDGQTSGSSGGNSGQHLIINLDGTQYKIKLENN